MSFADRPRRARQTGARTCLYAREAPSGSLRSRARGAQRQLDPDVGAAVGMVRGARDAAVRVRDDLHDRQAEAAAAARAGGVGAREALERLGDELRREAGPLVATCSSTTPSTLRG